MAVLVKGVTTPPPALDPEPSYGERIRLAECIFDAQLSAGTLCDRVAPMRASVAMWTQSTVPSRSLYVVPAVQSAFECAPFEIDDLDLDLRRVALRPVTDADDEWDI
jgi:hypothetical protein